jgi:hypothetical protein
MRMQRLGSAQQWSSAAMALAADFWRLRTSTHGARIMLRMPQILPTDLSHKFMGTCLVKVRQIVVQAANKPLQQPHVGGNAVLPSDILQQADVDLALHV